LDAKNSKKKGNAVDRAEVVTSASQNEQTAAQDAELDPEKAAKKVCILAWQNETSSQKLWGIVVMQVYMLI
jgi:hypothetical protein